MPTPNVPNQLKSMTMIYWSLAAAQMFVGGITYFLVSTGTLGVPDYALAITFQQIALLLVPSLMAAGYFMFRFRLGKIDLKRPLDSKLRDYFGLVIVRGALFEAATLFVCVAALVTNVLLFLYMAPVVFIVFLLLRPTAEAIINDLQLSPDEATMIRQG